MEPPFPVLPESYFSDFFHKCGVSKIGKLLLKKFGVSIGFTLTNLFCVCVCVLCSFTLFLSAFYMFPWKDMVLLNLISRYMASPIENFLKNKGIVYLLRKVCF